MSLSLAVLLAGGQLVARPRPAEAGVVAAAVGAVVGLAAGIDLTVAIHVLRVRLTGWAATEPEDLVSLRPEAAPLLLGPVIGAAVGFQSSTLLASMVGTGLAGAGLGVATGILFGQLVWGRSEGRWAGGITGGALGLLLGAALAYARRRRPGLRPGGENGLDR